MPSRGYPSLLAGTAGVCILILINKPFSCLHCNHTQVTGVVADLLRNKRSIPYARAWRSDLNMLSITQLMVRLWVAEESRLRVSRPNGVLQNLWEPLQSHDRARGRRSLTKTSAKRVRSRPTSGEAGAGPSRSTASGGASGVGSATLGVRSSRTITTQVADPDGAAESLPSADLLDGASTPMPSLNEVGEGVGSRGNDGTCAANEADRGDSSAVALALEAGRRAVAIGQGGGDGGQRKRASQMGVEESVAKAMMNLDLRGKIAAVLGMVGFDGGTTEGLGPTDLKASYMATSYMDFRAGEAWQEVRGIFDLSFAAWLHFGGILRHHTCIENKSARPIRAGSVPRKYTQDW